MRRGRDLFLGLLLLGGLSVAVRHRLEQKADDDLQTCKANLKNITTACETYSVGNAGRYPLSLDKLVPEYLTKIPTCPGADSESAGYAFQSATSPDTFSMGCQGLNHRGRVLFANYPQHFRQSSICER